MSFIGSARPYITTLVNLLITLVFFLGCAALNPAAFSEVIEEVTIMQIFAGCLAFHLVLIVTRPLAVFLARGKLERRIQNISTKIKMTEGKRKMFEKYEKWTKLIKGCEELREPTHLGIPAPLPMCALTERACRIDNCPKVKNNEQS